MNNETVLKMINKRIDELHKRVDELVNSYGVLNDSHQTLENGFIRMETEWKTTKGWIKFIFGTSLLGFVMGLLTALRQFGVI